MPINPKRMPFFDHFAEFRRRATMCLTVVVLLCMAFYLKPANALIESLLFGPIKPYLPVLPGGVKGFVTTGPFESMTFRFQVAAFGALIVASPLILYHLFVFFSPALKERERKWVLPTVAVAIILFILGVAFSYFFIVPAAFEWLSQQNTSMTTQLPIARQWFSGVSMILLGFGLSFELPLVVFYIIGLGIVPYHTVRESWRVAYVGIAVIAAIATPDWSPYPMLGLSLALIILFEGSLLASQLIFKKRIDQQCINAYENMLMYDDEPTDDPLKLKKRERITARAVAARARIASRKAEDEETKEIEDRKQ